MAEIDAAHILRNADRLEADVITLDAAVVVLYNRGSIKLAEQIRRTAVEWNLQVQEMRHRAKGL